MIISILLHVAVSTLFAYFLSWAFGALTTWIAALSLTLGAVAAWKANPWFKSGFDDLKVRSFSFGVNGWIERVLFIVIGYAAFRHFAWMIFEVNSEISTLSANNFGDLPLHINYIRQFASGAQFLPVNPEFPLEPLRYPLGVDLYSALWEILRVPLMSHFFIFGMAATIISLTALRALGGWLVIGGFFFNGGLLSLEIIGKGLPAAVENNLAWKNLFLTVFITQRGILYALPVGILLLHFLQRAASSGFAKVDKRPILVFGFLWGSLALFHLHSFMAVSLLMLGLACIHGRAGLMIFLKLLVPAFPLASYFVLHSTGFLQKASVIHWKPGWMQETTGFAQFTFLNFGVWPIFIFMILALGIFAQFSRRSENQTRLLMIWCLGAAFFALFMNLMFASWAWDNIKVLIWPYLLLLAVSYRILNLFFERGPLAILYVVLALILLSPGASRVVKTLGGAKNATGLYSVGNLAMTEGATKSLPPDAVIAASQTHNHTLTWFGRIRALGYDGHLWSHGIEYRTQSADLKELMSGGPGWKEAAKRLKATHVFWGPTEQQAYREFPHRLKLELKNISSVPGYGVYELPKN